MDYKKKYRELIEKIELISHSALTVEQHQIIDTILGEIKESEDEKIKNALIRFHKSTIDIDGIKGEDVVAWLEKQGESYTKRDVDDAWLKGMCDAKRELEKQSDSPIKWNKNTKDCKPKVRHSVLMKTNHGIAEGEWQGEYWHQYRWAGIVRDTDVLSWMELFDLEKQGEQKSIWHNEDEEPKRGSLILLIMQSGTPIVAKIIESNHTFNHGERWAYIDDLLEEQGEQKASYTTLAETGNGGINALVAGEVSVNSCDYEERPVDKTKPKFHRGEQNTNHKTMIVKFICKKDWHGIGDYYYGKIYNGYPCEKEQKGYDIYDDNHIPTFCDEDFINEYFNIITEEKREEQKFTWSEEDERILKATINTVLISRNSCEEDDEIKDRYDDELRWLKSLRPQKQWKPSDEQLEALKNAIHIKPFENPSDSILWGLYEQLKKLREE